MNQIILRTLKYTVLFHPSRLHALSNCFINERKALVQKDIHIPSFVYSIFKISCNTESNFIKQCSFDTVQSIIIANRIDTKIVPQ